MKRLWGRTVLLAAAVFALGLFVYLKPGTGPVEHALSPLTSAGARLVRLERTGKEPIVVEKRGEDWLLTSPFAAPADPLQMERLLAVTQAKSSVRLAATDLARFDLERPAVRLLIDGQQFDFGMVNEVSREQYVLTGGNVHTISPRYGAVLPASAATLAARQLLARNEVPVRMELNGFTVAKQDGKWVLEPAARDLSQDDLQAWIDEWRNASALHVERFGRGQPLSEVRMRLSDDKALSLGILSREPEVALLRSDRQLVYYLSSTAARRLLAPPAAREDRATK